MPIRIQRSSVVGGENEVVVLPALPRLEPLDDLRLAVRAELRDNRFRQGERAAGDFGSSKTSPPP
jgi:hypothetical protein